MFTPSVHVYRGPCIVDRLVLSRVLAVEVTRGIERCRSRIRVIGVGRHVHSKGPIPDLQRGIPADLAAKMKDPINLSNPSEWPAKQGPHNSPFFDAVFGPVGADVEVAGEGAERGVEVGAARVPGGRGRRPGEPADGGLPRAAHRLDSKYALQVASA